MCGLSTIPRVGLAEHGCGVLLSQESPSMHIVLGSIWWVEDEAVLEHQIEVMLECVYRLVFSCCDVFSVRRDLYGVLDDPGVVRKV